MAATGLKICKTCERIYRSESDFLSGTSRWRIDERNNLYFNCSCDSSLIILKGQYDWYSPEKLLSSNAYALFQDLSLGKNIPQVPASMTSLQEALKNPNNSASEITALIKQNPMLATDILRSANIMKAAANEKPLASLEQACIYIGRETLANLIMVASVRLFSFKTQNYTQEIFWKESLLCGAIGEFIAHRFPAEQSLDEVYLACTLANIGKVIAAISVPESADQVFQTCKQKECDWKTAEKQINAPCHEILGEIACIFWALPTYVIRATCNHHGEKEYDLDDQFQALTDIVTFANQATHWLLGQPYRLNLKTLEESYQKLNFPEKYDVFLEGLIDFRNKIDKILNQ